MGQSERLGLQFRWRQTLLGQIWVKARQGSAASYNADLKPLEIKFDRLELRVRILALKPQLMIVKVGNEIAKPIGNVLHIEADNKGRCWGRFMQLRVEVDVNEPLVRWVTIFSSRDKSTEKYKVKFERLPLYCFSCGVLGHSSLACPSPAEQEEDNSLPYVAKRLCVTEENKKSSGTRSGNASSSAGTDQFAKASKISSRGSLRPTNTRGRGKFSEGAAPEVDGEGCRWQWARAQTWTWASQQSAGKSHA